MTTRKKRNQYIVDKQQYKVSAVIVFYNVFAVFLAALLVFLPSFIGFSSGEDSATRVAAANEILVLHKRFWPAIMVVAVVLGTHSIFFFHRLFGPLYRFKVVMKEVGQGDFSHNFNIRPKDFLVAEKEVMNEMIVSLRENMRELKQDNKLLVETIDQLDSSLEDQDLTMDTVRQKVNEIQQNVGQVSKGLDKFKVT